MYQNTSSLVVAEGMVENILQVFNGQLIAKQIVKKLPQNLQEKTYQIADEVIFAGNFPKPNRRRQPLIREDKMPNYSRKQVSLTGRVRIINKSQIESFQKSNNNYKRSSGTPRYSSASDITGKRTVKLNLQNIKSNHVIELRSQQSTAKSFRSAIELQSHIAELRRTFIKSLREKQELSRRSVEIIPKRKKIPKQFTFDYNFNIIQNQTEARGNGIISPLRPNHISNQKIIKQKKNPEVFNDLENDIQQQLIRNPTGQPEKEKRVYNNSSRRQVSHFPYISLVENSKLFQNDNTFEGENLKQAAQTSSQWKQKSHFVPFFKPNIQKQQQFLTTQDEQILYPNTSYSSKNKKGGKISKNPRFFKKAVENRLQSSLEFHPLNVPRNHIIDQYYKIKAIQQ